MHPEIEKAKELLRELAVEEVTTAADLLVEAGEAEWKLDPQVPGVVGLVRPDSNRALLVVYVEDGDWELDETFEDSLY